MPAPKVIPAWVAFAVMAGTTTLSIGVSFLMKPKNTLGESGNLFDNPVIDPETYIPVIYGKGIMPLLPVFMDANPNNENLLMGIGGQCHGIVDGIEKIFFGNYELVVKLVEGDYEISEKFKGLIQFWQRKGGDTPKPYEHFVKEFRTWTSKHLGGGVASIALEMKYDQDKISSIPTAYILFRGRKLYDPRDSSTTYNSNPVLAVLDLLTHTKYGLGLNINTRIEIESFKAEANYCDELIDYELVEPPASALKIEIVEKKDDWLTSGSYYKYSYSYCRGTTISLESQPYTFSESQLSPESNSTGAITSYGKIKITNIADSGESDVTLKRIYREKDDSGVWNLIGSIDSDQTTFTDDIPDSQVGAIHSSTGTPPTTPTGASTATWTNYNSSGLDVNKWYRYKQAFITATGETKPSPASKRLRTRKTGASAIKLTGILESEDSQVTHVRIYRTDGFTSDAELTYKKLIDLTNGTKSYVDILGDGSLDSGVNPQSSTTTTLSKIKRFTCNGILDTGDDVFTNLEKVLSSCRGKLFKQSGKWKVFIPKAAIPEVFELNEDNIIGDWSYDLSSSKDMPNIVKATFTNPDTQWKKDTVIWPKTDSTNFYLKDDGDIKTNINLDLPFTNNKKIAKTICQVVRKESRNNIQVEVTAKEEARKLTIGNLIKVTHPQPGWVQKLFWVMAVGIFPDTNIRLLLKEYTESDYDYETLEEDTLPGADTTFPDPQDAPDEVSNVVIAEEQYYVRDTSHWRIKVNFTNPTSEFWDYSEVWVKESDSVDSEYEFYTQIDRLSEGVFYITGLKDSEKYYIKILSVSTLGVRTQLSDATEYSHTTTNVANPPDVENFIAIVK